MRDTLTAECFLGAISDYMTAKQEHDKARDEYIAGGGYSWGYYGREYVERKEKAAEVFKEWFDKLRGQQLPNSADTNKP